MLFYLQNNHLIYNHLSKVCSQSTDNKIDKLNKLYYLIHSKSQRNLKMLRWFRFEQNKHALIGKPGNL